MELTTPQKGKWKRLKAEIIERPFIAYSMGLSPKDIERLFLGGYPTLKELDELLAKMLDVREAKIERLRPVLTRVVGHRGSAQFAAKIHTDSMSIKYIIDKRYKSVPSHDLISRIEIYLNYLCDFELSLEYQTEAKLFFSGKIEELSLKASKVSASINTLPGYLEKIKVFDKKNTSQHYGDKYAIGSLTYHLDKAIEDLQEMRLEVETILENLIDV
ncbi:hypothetical protein [Pedobacter alluvionis]|uniref:Uncharacterized protein n=1 Tax=Pedobacter alluvionis TaxID=475253 RepID=A0A497XL82_9SPHI|nr:hypothetical protein [Pedobacter alluvionis]RLJ69206.1 hypothetical protein BCL90_5304 [Pedobacter alluvionis]TFB29751.1 hypothetical protein E3V97_16295 [Pedobacter alluvionis]